jgi:hypothetical protein
MPDEVLGNEPQSPREPEGQGKDAKVTISQSELDGLRRERDEARQSERDWANMARRGAEPQTEPAAETDDFDASRFEDPDLPGLPDGDTPEKLVEDIAKNGLKALKDRGFVSAKEAERIAINAARNVSREIVGQERQKITTDAQIFAEFPELKDQNSELFKETSANYRAAVAMDKGALKTPAALYLSAKAAAQTLKAKAAGSRRTASDDDDTEAEAERLQRVNSQDSRPRGRGNTDDNDDMMGPEAKVLMKAFGLSEAEFKASQKELGRRKR